MTDQQVQLLLFDLALIMVLARLFGIAAKRIGQPPVIGEIIAGILLGPTLFSGWITRHLFPAPVIPPLTALADIGLLLFMFVVGYEVDLALVRGREKVAGGVALGSILLPLALGVGLGAWLVTRVHSPNHATFILFFGVSMSITAFPVLARILTDRGLHRTRIGGLALAAASVDDQLAWILLAIVVAIASSSGGHAIRLAYAPLYAALLIFVVRPLLRRLADTYQKQGKLTANVLASILILLLLSGWATDYMGVKFIFGAFIFGILMPRNVPALRLAILDRLEQVTLLLFLPVFFVIAGLSVNLSTVGLSGLGYLGLIMVVAVVGKFGGAYYGARFTGVRRRQAGALAALMNTRGLTELVILTIGLSLGILNTELYSLMVVMAIVTTAMAGPLLRYIYPNQIMERDITEADRAAMGRADAHRVVVLVDHPATAEPLVDLAAQLAASRSNSEVVLCHLVAHESAGRLEVGGGLGGELVQMTETVSRLHQLAARATARNVPIQVQARFSEDVAAELPGYLTAADPDTIVLHRGAASLTELSPGAKAQLVILNKPLPETPTAAVAYCSRGADSDAAIQVAAKLAITDGVQLVLTPPGRPAASRAADLTKRGVTATTGTRPAGSLVVGPADLLLTRAAATNSATPARAADLAGTSDPTVAGNGNGHLNGGANGTANGDVDVHIAVVAGSNEASDDMDQWVEALAGHKQLEGRQQ
jgi:Kef-type K+ transport system membrane component KefB